MSTRFAKDPQAVLDYAWDWTDWLAAAETISTATITVTPSGQLTKDSQSIVAGVVTAWLSAGTAGERYEVACRIVTNQGRTDERTMLIDVRER